MTHDAVLVGVTDAYGNSGSTTVRLEDLPTHVSVVLMAAKRVHDKNTVKRRKQISKKQEDSIAKAYSGVRQLGSGNRPGYEGDVRVPGKYRIEAKYTTHKSYSVTRSALNKIRSECSLGESPLFFIEFREPSSLRLEDSWVLVPRKLWDAISSTSDD